MKRSHSFIVISISISLFVYLFYRPENTLVNELVLLVVSQETYTNLKNFITHLIPLNEHVIFSLPGGLWVFYTTLLSKDLYIKIRTWQIEVAIVPILFSLGLEFFQLIHLTNGRFDLWDIGFYIAFWLLASFSFSSNKSPSNILFPFTLNSFIFLTCFLTVYLAHVNQ